MPRNASRPAVDSPALPAGPFVAGALADTLARRITDRPPGARRAAVAVLRAQAARQARWLSARAGGKAASAPR